jgi:hypothetical protein
MAFKKVSIEYNLNSLMATVLVAENYRTKLVRGGLFPRIETTCDNLYKCMVTLNGIISAKENPAFDSKLFKSVETELRIRAWVKKYANYIVLPVVICLAIITVLGYFTSSLTDAGSDHALIAIAEMWSTSAWVLKIIISGLVFTYVARLFLGQITIFRPHAEIYWRNGGLHLSLVTEMGHSANRRALPTEDLQKMAWPLKLIIHKGDDQKYAAEIRAADDAKENYITIPNPGIRVGVYSINGVAGKYLRESPPFLAPGDRWEFSDMNFLQESDRQHARYCAEFARQIGPWGDYAIVSTGLTTGEQITEVHAKAYQAGRTVTFIFLMLLMATNAFATKTEQITSAIGEHSSEVAPNGARVKYMFDDKNFVRTGDGNRTILELLQAGSGFTEEENAGNFIAIEFYNSDGKKMYYSAAKATPVDPVRPNLYGASPKKFSMPDSVHIALAADQTLAWIAEKKQSLTKKGGYWWYVRVVSWPIISLFLLPGAWFFTMAYTSGKETDVRQYYKDFFFRVHEFSAMGCYIILAVPVIYLDTEAFIQLFVEGDGGFCSVSGFCIVVFSLAWLYAQIVPNRTGTKVNNRTGSETVKQLQG